MYLELKQFYDPSKVHKSFALGQPQSTLQLITDTNYRLQLNLNSQEITTLAL